MNHGPTEARDVHATSSWRRHAARHDRTVIFFPPALTFAAVSGTRKDRSDIRLGVQNVHTEEKGAFTGETLGGDRARCRRRVRARRPLGAPPRVRRDRRADREEVRAASPRRRLTPMLCVGETARASASAARRSRSCSRQLRTGISDARRPPRCATMIDRVRAGVGHRHRAHRDAGRCHRGASRDSRGARRPPWERARWTIPILYGGSVNARQCRGTAGRRSGGRTARGRREPGRGGLGDDLQR